MTKLKLIDEKPAFPSPILWFEVPGAAALNEALIADTKAIRADSDGINRSNYNGWHSKNDLFTRPEASFKQLTAFIHKATMAMTQKVAPDYDIRNRRTRYIGWINVNSEGAFNQPHRHPGCHWSGCYYVSVPETSEGRSGEIEFLDPRVRENMSPFGSADYSAVRLRYKPVAGALVVFPSYLMHWVYPNHEQEERVSIAFNATLLDQAKPAADTDTGEAAQAAAVTDVKGSAALQAGK